MVRTINGNILYKEHTRYSVNNSIKRYIKYKEKELDRVCRKIWTAENPQGILYMYANFCRNYNKLIITIAYYTDNVGFVPIEIGKDVNLLNSKKDEMNNNHDIFVEELRKITGLSLEYCSAAFHTLQDRDRKNPKKAAADYKKKFNL